jgi:hypothetical protein
MKPKRKKEVVYNISELFEDGSESSSFLGAFVVPLLLSATFLIIGNFNFSNIYAWLVFWAAFEIIGFLFIAKYRYDMYHENNQIIKFKMEFGSF